MLKMIKENKIKLLVSSLVVLLPIVYGLIMWDKLPDPMPSHWNINGEVDGFTSRQMGIILVPIIMLIVHWVCVLATFLDPNNREQNSKVLNLIYYLAPTISIVVSGFMYSSIMEMKLRYWYLMGLVFVVIGNYLPKCKRNSTIGIRIPWTLGNEENWNATHRFSGKIWVACGLIGVTAMFLPEAAGMTVLIIALVLIAAIPIIYSYMYHRKQLELGTATTDDFKNYIRVNRYGKAGVVITILALVFVAFALLVGKYEVNMGEDSLKIEATFWADYSVKYDEISNVEYREKDTPGSRTNGYGTPSLSMGQYSNNEFGYYTRYTYSSCNSCVVLTIGDDKLVINEKDETSTKELYNKLLEKVR
ncbi:MAG: DUF1648 domain-containing protein [Lachnospiraceae bacterium]|nr:DUF1648 domain-containing protein [Lachnospiraceae bacterium]